MTDSFFSFGDDPGVAQIVVTYWRDIPSQVTSGKGRKAVKKMLPERFQDAIDMAAMRAGASRTDAYLADWRRAEPVEVEGQTADAVAEMARRLEQEFDDDRLKQLIANGGRAGKAAES